MKEKSLENVLKKRLQDFEPTESVPSWQQMQRRMQLYANAHPELTFKRSLIQRFGYGMAAAVLLCALGLGVYQLTQQQAPDTAQTLAALTEKHIRQPEVQSAGDSVLTQLLQSAKQIRIISPKSGGEIVALSTSHYTLPETEIHTDAGQLTAETTDQQPHTPVTFSAPQTPISQQMAARYAETFNTPKPLHQRRHAWATSAFANTSTFSSVSGAEGATPMFSSLQDGLVHFSTTPRNNHDFSRGVLDHKFPISVGLNVRKYVTPRLGIETGLVYSFLESSAEIGGAFNYHYNQKVHYLGIPLSLTYSVLDSKRFDIYFIGGFMAEKALSAHGTTKIYNGSTFTTSISTQLPAKGIFWSAHLGTGLAYNFVPRFGLYVEPEINYYFRNDNQPQSYRTANPWNVNIRMGLRYNF